MYTEIRVLSQDDPAVLGLVELMQEMQAHYGVHCPPRDEIVANVTERPAAAEIPICEDEGTVIGFAAFSAIYPGPGLKRGIFLKELYVSAAQRDRGLEKRSFARLPLLL